MDANEHEWFWEGEEKRMDFYSCLFVFIRG